MTSSTAKSLFGRRLKQARIAIGLAQDKLGVMIGLDESCSSARMSRYENGIHAPAFEIAQRIAEAMNLPTSYFYCADDDLAELLILYHQTSQDKKKKISEYIKDLTQCSI